MYSRKSVGPRMDPWATPAFLWGLSIQNHLKPSITEKRGHKTKYLTWKALAILSDKTVRRSAVDQEDLKRYWKSEKRPHFSRSSTILLFTKILNTLLTTERRLTSIIIAYFCFKLIGSRGVINTNLIEVDVFQEYLRWSSFLLGKAFHSYFFLYVSVGSELLYSSCYLDCITYNYLF